MKNLINFSRIVLGITMIFFCSFVQATFLQHTSSVEKERAVYQQAITRLKQPTTMTEKDFNELQLLLNHYPLKPYFEYAYLKKKFKQLPVLEVDNFLQQYAGSYIAFKMQSQWLAYLASHKKWELYRQFYSDSGIKSQQCTALLSDLALDDNKAEIFTQTTQLWLSHKSLPNSCNPLFKKWQQAGYLTTALAWQRFQMAYAANNKKLAKYLSKKLSSKDQKVAVRLLNPQRYKQRWFKDLADMNAQTELASGSIKRLLRKLASTDHQQVSRLVEYGQLPMNKDDMRETKKLCAWYYAKNDADKAQDWLKNMPGNADEQLQEFELRFALQAKNWLNYKRVYLQTTVTTQQKPEWLYWYALAQLQSGKKAINPDRQPEVILKQLSKQRNFYGFLAAEQDNNSQYSIHNTATKIILDTHVPSKLAAAFELYHLGENREANRNWFFVTRSFDHQQWQQAAVLADQQQWYERSIQAHAKAQLWDMVDARFPLAFAEDFTKNSDLQNIDASWLFAMARQESAFSPQARSHVGARGLLQLMPKTAKKVAHSLNLRFNINKLNEPAYNITLGSKYLKDLLLKFNNNYILATAAYNAGPHRVNEWLGLRPITEDWVHWVATIPYEETRKYVQNILTYSVIYQSRLDKKQQSMLSFFATDFKTNSVL